MEISPKLYLLEIQRATNYLLRRIHGTPLQSYLADEDLQFLAELNFIRIGEAMRLLRQHFPEVSQTIEHETKIIAFRNLLVHHYWNIDHRAVWAAINENVLPLKEAVETILITLSTDSIP